MENNKKLGKHMAEKIILGDLVEHGELAVVPLLAVGEGGPDYISLKEAFGMGGFSVSEVNESLSVPKLKVTNGTSRNVLMLDGEELAGAKQNRVLNRSILLPVDDSRVIPVFMHRAEALDLHQQGVQRLGCDDVTQHALTEKPCGLRFR